MQLNRILITRPLDQADTLIQSTQALGLEPIVLPIFRIKPIHNQAIKTEILQFDQYNTIIVTSKNAAKELIKWLDAYWPQLPIKQKFFAIGSETAKSLAIYHINALVPKEMHSEGLIRLIKTQASTDAKRILICKGEGGREYLEETLKKQITNQTFPLKITKVKSLKLYRRTQLPHQPADLITKLHQADLLICTSEETLQTITAIAKKLKVPIQHLPLIVSSQRLYHIATSLNFDTIHISDNATDASLMTTLHKLKYLNKPLK